MVKIGKEIRRKLAMLVAAVMIAAQLPATAMAADPASQTARTGAELSGLNLPPRLAANTYAGDGLTTTGTEYPFEMKEEGLTIKTSDASNVEYTAGDGFKLKKDGAYEISGTWTGTLTGVGFNNPKTVITVTSGVEANITLNNLSIDASIEYDACALAIEPGGEADITLSGTNTLISGNGRAGLEVPERARVTINGGNSDKLIAQSYGAGGGIGGGYGSGGAITINGGSVTAESNWGAGIGGGGSTDIGGSGGAITINGGSVTAKSIAGAGIGGGSADGGSGSGGNGGNGGSGGAITIKGGSVTAESNLGAGIGGGGNDGRSGRSGSSGGSGGAITIKGGSVTAESNLGAGIGGGGNNGRSDSSGGSGGAITINRGSVTAKSITGAGIGGGGSTDIGGSGGAITINGGSVTAESNWGAGIGSGSGGIYSGSGGAITIKGGITTARSRRGAGIGGSGGIGGGNGGNGGAVTIEGGIVTAESNVGAGIGGGAGLYNAGSGSDFTINGDALVFAKSDKAAAIGGGIRADGNGNVTGGLGDEGKKAFTKGVAFEGNTGTVYGDPKLPGNITIPAGYELTVPADASLTIPDGIELDNKGSIINNGTLNIYGSITGNQPSGGGIINRASATEVTFAVKENGGYGNATATAKFGDTIQITATAQRRDARTLNSRKAGLNKVDFYIGSTASEYNIGVADVTIEGGKAVARLEITLSGEAWDKGFAIGENTIIADFGGSSSLNLLDGFGTARLTINKISQPTPAAPELHSKTASSIKVNAISGQSYICTADSAGPIPGAGDWKNAANAEMEFTGLEQGAEYYIWTYAPESKYALASEVSQPLMVTTLISEAEVSITAPAVGNAPDSSAAAPANAGYEVSEVAWVPSDAIFEAGKAYTVRVTLAPKANYSFADIASISGRLNGNNAVVTAGSTAGTITLSYQFDELRRRRGGSSSSSEPLESYTAAGGRINQSVARTDLSLLANSGKSLSLSCDNASMRFSTEALRAILAAVPATAANVIFRAAPADLSGYPEAMEAVGSRPAYDFTISYRDINGNTATIQVDFPTGSASVSLAYELAENEVSESLFMAYVDENGNVSTVDGFSYRNDRLSADVPHFSVYGVGYQTAEAEPDMAAEPVFSDIANHWAKEDIEFVQARGLLSGTGGGLFSPDMDMTRGMFVTALGRLAGINSDEYSSRSFADVAQGSYYAPYVEWAAQMNIVQGSGDGLFMPDAPITREQMAVIMTNYANQKRHAIPVVNSAASFADSGDISPWAVGGVSAMQRAGIINGRDGNRLDPRARATRSEVSAVLRRFVEVVIDSSAE